MPFFADTSLEKRIAITGSASKNGQLYYNKLCGGNSLKNNCAVIINSVLYSSICVSQGSFPSVLQAPEGSELLAYTRGILNNTKS
jgi:hypothetical protein